jgi:molybdopterin-containing oxidoreductase family iron-sulfur binding subunit
MEPVGGLSRRTFLKLVGVGSAGALAGCAAPPAERLLPYVVPPDDQVLGIATWYATTCLECPAGCGLHVRTREGRALKIEGNPDHPVNRGTVCARGQAAVQGLYNPDRIPRPRAKDGGRWVDITWEEAEKRLADKLRAAAGRPGAVQFWTEGATGSWNALLGEWCAAVGAERVAYEAFDYAPVREAARRVFGTGTVPLFDLSRARFVLSLGADFLDTWGSPLAQSRGYDAVHSGRAARPVKHVQVEPRLSLTGHNADQWIAIRPGTEAVFALGLAQKLGAAVSGYDLGRVAEVCDVPVAVLEKLALELGASRPALVLGPGVAASAANATETWQAVFVLNQALGAVGAGLVPSPGFEPGATLSFAQARKKVEQLAQGGVELLLVHGTNPAYTLAGAGGFAEAAAKAKYRVSFSSYPDETTELCDLVLPDHHPLESWGDSEPAAGVRGLVQPTMRPVFQTRQTADVLLAAARALGGAAAAKLPAPGFREYLMHRWGGSPDDFDAALARGGDLPRELPAAAVKAVKAGAPTAAAAEVAGDGDLTLVVYPHPHFYDGRGANKPWLQEIPDPVTKVVWDPWCELHPDTAKRLGVETGDVLALESPGGRAELPAYVNALMRPDVVAVPLGQGHTAYGRYAEGRGANAFALLPAAADAASGGRAFLVAKVRATRTGKHEKLVFTGGPGRQMGRGIAQAIPLTVWSGEAGAKAPEHGAYGAPNENETGPLPSTFHAPKGGPEGTAPPLTFPTFRDFPEQLDGLHAKPMAKEDLPPAGSVQYNRTTHRWGMSVDLSSCVGCNACVAACYAENNIAIVGKQNMTRGREMAWIRIERYYEETPEGTETRFAPMMCQQCGNAPCETVCPVYATYHNPEGLNVQVYNRCVGTRYCGNNCPYKVRAFNWFQYEWPSPLHWQLNPDLTARSKGVMEKCTFCIQRIKQGRDVARDENRDLKDGDITPACAQACPTRAIVFGDLADPQSEVARRTRDPRGYHVFETLNTLPAVTYLKKVSRRAPDAPEGEGAA